MVAIAIPLLETAAGAMAKALPAMLSGTALAAAFSLSGDQAKEKDRADAKAMPRTRERKCKCPPEHGSKVQRNHAMQRAPREYQGRITGFEYEVIGGRTGWSMEWCWETVDFDGFRPAQCLLQEAKGNYDQFVDEDGRVKFFFTGFKTMMGQVGRQAALVRGNSPAKLMWYFQTPRAWAHMQPTLRTSGVPSVCEP
jgi:hypothetical protein